MTLESFKDQFLSWDMTHFKVIEARNSGNRMSLVAYRKFPFQAELVVWMPNLVLPAHRHPNIDAFGVFVSGDTTLLIGKNENHANELIDRARIWPAKKLAGRALRIRPGDWHGGKTGPTGATFWSIQKWECPDMTAAGIDWEGPTLPVPKLGVMAS